MNGCFEMQKVLAPSTNQALTQKQAEEMYERIFKFKFLPPGRGLWAMGT